MIAYNGHDFSEFASVSISMENVYNASHVVTGQRYKISVKDYILSGQDKDGEGCEEIDGYMTTLKNMLMEKRKALSITGIGFGNIDLANLDEEINFGPIPISMNWEPVGAARAAVITWVCEFTLSPCDGDYFGVSGFTLSCTHSINEKGYASVNYSGSIEVSAASAGNLDSYRSFFVVAPSTNCQRTQNWNQQDDRRHLTFTITDREIESPNAYPAGVVSISAPTTLSVRLPGQNLATSARVMISCTMELRGTETRLRAWAIWNSVLAARLGRIAAEENDYILRDMTVTEDWYTNHYSFSCVVTHYRKNLIQHLGNFSFFASISQDWSIWSQSMQTAQRPRGLKNLSINLGDRQQNLCDSSPVTVSHTDIIPFPPLAVLLTLCNPRPTPEKSWIDFDAELIEAPKIEGVAYTTYGETEISQNPFNVSESNNTKPTFDFRPAGDGYTVKYAQSPSVQRYIWRGTATRIGFPIPPPTKVTLNGVPMKVAGEPRVVNDLVGYQYCQPIYQATWSIGLIYDQEFSPGIRDINDPSGLKAEGDYTPS